MTIPENAPPSVEEFIRRGKRSAERGDLGSAIDLLIKGAIASAPDNPAPYLELMDILIERGLFDDALQVLPEIPSHAEAAHLLEREALCRSGRGEDDEAGNAAQKVLESNPASSTALTVTGTLKARRGEMAEAEAFFRRAVTADPRNARALLSLGMLLWSGGNLTEAFDALCHAVDTGPTTVDTVTIFLDMAHRLDRLQDAMQVLKKASNTHPHNRLIASEKIKLMAELALPDQVVDTGQAFLVKFGIDDDILNTAIEARRKMGIQDRLAEGGAESISLCMIVKNEEKNLPRCLASAGPVVHEILIADTGSDDRTVAVAEVFGAHIVRIPWNGDYAEARNAALEAVRGAWVLVLDADEVLSEREYPLIREAVRQGTGTAWQVVTRNYTDSSAGQGWEPNDGSYATEEAASGWYPSWKARLFPRRDSIRFQGRVHEMVEPALRKAGFDIKRATFVVHHYGEVDREASLARKRSYYILGKEKLAEHPDDPILLTELAVQAGELSMPSEALALWERVLAGQPDNIEALFNSGGVLLVMERHAESREHSRRALALRPDFREALLNLAMAELCLGELEQSRTHLEHLECIASNHPPFWGLALMTAIIAGEGKKAEKFHNLLERHGFGIAEIITQRADTLERAGQVEQALRLRKWQREVLRSEH